MNLRRNSRFLAAIALLAVTAGFLHARAKEEFRPSREPLSSFPRSLGTRSGVDYPLSQDVLDILGNGDFLLRLYPDSAGAADVDLFIAYFATQRAGDSLHSPQNCLPGAGWFPVQNTTREITAPGLAPFPANEYLIVKGEDRKLVLYWYQAHNRALANEYWAKFYLVADAMRHNRSDGSMIRITTPVAHGERIEAARTRLLAFAAQVAPQLEPYIPQ